MDKISNPSYDMVVARTVTSSNGIPSLRLNENNEFVAIPVNRYYKFISFNNLYQSFINMFCCDNKRK